MVSLAPSSISVKLVIYQHTSFTIITVSSKAGYFGWLVGWLALIFCFVLFCCSVFVFWLVGFIWFVTILVSS